MNEAARTTSNPTPSQLQLTPPGGVVYLSPCGEPGADWEHLLEELDRVPEAKEKFLRHLGNRVNQNLRVTLNAPTPERLAAFTSDPTCQVEFPQFFGAPVTAADGTISVPSGYHGSVVIQFFSGELHVLSAT